MTDPSAVGPGTVPATTSAPWRIADAQVLVEDLADPVLGGDAAHHLGRVLRLRDGATVCATDGCGGWVVCRFDGAGALEPFGPVSRAARPSPELTVGFALVKGQKPELVVQKLTELGIDRIVVFSARRSVVRWDDERSARNIERLQRVAAEACAQCRRLWLPQVGAATLSSLVAEGAVVADAGGRRLGPSDTAVLIGPEGGWDPLDMDEQGQVPGAGRGPDRIGLGENVLRAETAAITAGVLLATHRAGLLPGAGN